MTRNPRRAAVALAILAACLFAILYMSGCASFHPDYTWSRYGPPSAAYQWKVVPASQIHSVCNLPKTMAVGACVYYSAGFSTVYSYFTEEAAKRVISGDGETLWEHEMRHVRGEIHQ